MSQSKTSFTPLNVNLAELGWQQYFVQQLTLEEWDDYDPGRIIEHHKSQLTVAMDQASLSIPMPPSLSGNITVGDWVLLDADNRIHRVLDRKSKFSRKAAGSKLEEQLIAANVDTLFIVSSLNQDFNLNRIERYLVLANETGVEPVVLLTKSDLCDSEDVSRFVSEIRGLDPMLMVITLNALDEAHRERLSPWCKKGQTLALLGSSGVGKSTLTNLLMGNQIQTTHGIREDDSKGRHTTTGRSLHVIPENASGLAGLLLDTPGMRELQLANVETGISETFSDILELAQHCKYKDCNHDPQLTSESGCAVQQAVLSGTLDQRRLLSYLKLQREDEFNSASLAERRDKDRKFGKMIRSVQNASRSRKNR